jgi:hypothetical protein
MLPLIPGFYKNTCRMFDTQFFGCDVSGNFLNTKMDRNERFFLFGSHQSVGVANYAERLCIFSGTFPGLRISYDQFIGYEKKFSIRWVCIDVLNSGIAIMNQDPQVLTYLQKHYGIESVGILKDGENIRLASIILKKPGEFDLNSLNSSSIFSHSPIVQKEYELTGGTVLYLLFSK